MSGRKVAQRDARRNKTNYRYRTDNNAAGDVPGDNIGADLVTAAKLVKMLNRTERRIVLSRTERTSGNLIGFLINRVLHYGKDKFVLSRGVLSLHCFETVFHQRES